MNKKHSEILRNTVLYTAMFAIPGNIFMLNHPTPTPVYAGQVVAKGVTPVESTESTIGPGYTEAANADGTNAGGDAEKESASVETAAAGSEAAAAVGKVSTNETAQQTTSTSQPVSSDVAAQQTARKSGKRMQTKKASRSAASAKQDVATPSEAGKSDETSTGNASEKTESADETEADSENKGTSTASTENQAGTKNAGENTDAKSGHQTEASEPQVEIKISVPDGWFKNKAEVSVSAEDSHKTGQIKIEKLEAKFGENGSWQDITNKKKVTVTKKGELYIRATDQNGKTYEKETTIDCFDTSKPTLNAAINNGRLTIQAKDKDSDVKAIYVDEYEYDDLTDGTLTIQLQKFDAGYQEFSIQAMDEAGNMSKEYRLKNPYYRNPSDDSTQDNPVDQLPSSALPSAPSSAAGVVTEHVRTDGDGNVTQDVLGTSRPASVPTGDISETGIGLSGDAADGSITEEGGEGQASGSEGKEFYTIESASGKVFYLVIDRSGNTEKTYFLTEISDNDLLNVTDNKSSDTLPQNAAISEASISSSEDEKGSKKSTTAGLAFPNNNTSDSLEETDEDIAPVETEPQMTMPAVQSETPKKKGMSIPPFIGWIVLGAIVAAGGAGVYFMKQLKKKKEKFVDVDEDEDEEEDDPYVIETADEDDEDFDAYEQSLKEDAENHGTEDNEAEDEGADDGTGRKE